MRLSVVIPCLNEARTIAAVVAEAAAGFAECADVLEWSEIVVSDNGSTDGSRELAAAAGARVVDCPVPGYGAALHWGIAHARGDYVVFGDADMSYDFTLLPRFVEALRAGPLDLVVGSRLKGQIEPGAMPFLNRVVGTPALNLAIRLCFGFNTSDCNSGMRLVRHAFYRSLNMRCSGMEWASELLIKTAIRGGRYQEVPIRLRPDQRGRAPHMRRWRDGWRHLKSIIMLAPNVTILAPSMLLAVIAPFIAPATGGGALAALWFAYAGLLVGFAIKMALHVEDVRPSRTIAGLLRMRIAEGGLLLAMGLMSAGAVLVLRPPNPDDVRVLGAFLLSAGAITALGVLYWETVRTHLVSALEVAWTAPHEPDNPGWRPRAATSGRDAEQIRSSHPPTLPSNSR